MERWQTWLSERGRLKAFWAGLGDVKALWHLAVSALTEVVDKDGRGRRCKSPPVFYLLMNVEGLS